MSRDKDEAVLQRAASRREVAVLFEANMAYLKAVLTFIDVYGPRCDPRRAGTFRRHRVQLAVNMMQEVVALADAQGVPRTWALEAAADAIWKHIEAAERLPITARPFAIVPHAPAPPPA